MAVPDPLAHYEGVFAPVEQHGSQVSRREGIDSARCACKEGARLEERAGEGGGQHCQKVDCSNPQPSVGHLEWESNEQEEDQVDEKVLVARGMDEAVGEEPPGLIPLARVEDEG